MRYTLLKTALPDGEVTNYEVIDVKSGKTVYTPTSSEPLYFKLKHCIDWIARANNAYEIASCVGSC